MKGKRVLVTGASGFLGSEIVRQAAAAGWWVRGLSRSADVPAEATERVLADVNDQSRVSAAVTGMDAVIHAAGLAHQFGQAGLDGSRFSTVNEQGTAVVAQQAAHHGVANFVLVSSVAVYGTAPGPWIEETRCFPDTPYATSKLRAESAAAMAVNGGNMRLTVLRMATVYGEEDPGNIGKLLRQIHRRRFVWVGAGTNRKSVIYRSDAARACVAAIDRQGAAIETCNVATSCCTVRELVDNLGTALRQPIPPWHIPANVALKMTAAAAVVAPWSPRVVALHSTVVKWLAESVCDARRFAELAAFGAEIDLQEGLRRQADWYRNRELENASPKVHETR